MIGDKIILKKKYLEPAEDIINQSNINGSKYTICVGGESGSGKTTLAHSLQKVLTDNKGLESCLLHMDDYFIKPPQDNHNQRLLDINNVGPHEVNLQLLDSHIMAFKQGTKSITKPLVHYGNNAIHSETIEVENISVLIIEGTYTLGLQHCDLKIFIDRTYKQTYEARVKRGRDQIIPFNERVLLIEHNIISKHKEVADFIMNAEYQII